MQSIDVAEYLALAEAITGTPGDLLRRIARISEAESALAAPFASFDGIEFYEDTATKAAILCSRLIRNHPLPDGNKRAALLAMLLFLDRNGCEWIAPDQDELATVIEALAAREISEREFIAWVGEHVA